MGRRTLGITTSPSCDSRIPEVNMARKCWQRAAKSAYETVGSASIASDGREATRGEATQGQAGHHRVR